MEKEITMPTAEQIRAAYKKVVGYTALEAMLKELYPDVLKPQDNRPVTERIKTFDDALRELGEKHDAVKAYRALMGERVFDDAKDILTYLKLRVITAALNEGWQPQFTEDETRWYVWYWLSFRDNIEDLDDDDKCRVVGRSYNNGNANGGLVYAHANNASSYSHSSYGSRLAFKTEALALYAGKQFAELYGDYLLNGLQPIEK